VDEIAERIALAIVEGGGGRSEVIEAHPVWRATVRMG
ncbi:MAG: LacI family transcriptional regulator, partial [Rhodobacteraceae bacterium]|nr:LacI family transcriptional regulator [Paracoccaceae bacterium]